MDEEQELTLEQSIAMLLDEVPAPVRDFVLNDLSSATGRIMDRYHLHIDQAGILERELLLMLLGQEEPAEFAASLTRSGIVNETVMSIVSDVNRDVFMKLRERERQTALPPRQEEPRRPAPLPPPALIPPGPAPEVATIPEIRAVPPPPPNLPGQEPVNRLDVQLPIQQEAAAPVQPLARPAPPVSIPVAAPLPERESAHITRTMAHDMDALKHGANPMAVAHPDLVQPAPATAVTAPRPTAHPAAPPIARPRYDSISEPALSSPVFRPHTFTNTPSPSSGAPYPIAAPAAHPDAPLTKEYGSDPYREPVE